MGTHGLAKSPRSAPESSEQITARARALGEDQRGAIMVLGIFMCSCIVGVLWYVAGIGDAIVYRERMQEAADAVAFSGATLHARGMNLIVLLNLLMAIILAVRVALKMLILALTIATVIFGIIGLIPFCCGWAFAVAKATGEAATKLDNLLTKTINPIIDEALVALHGLETVVARVVPPAASLGSLQVAEKYKPAVKAGVGTNLAEITTGLPVEDGSEDQLCGKAGEAAAMVVALPLEKIKLGKGAKILKGIMGKIARAGSGYFCGMGSGGNAPDLDSIYEDQAEDTCDKKQEQLRIDYNDARGKWHTACRATAPPATCTDPNPFLIDQTQMSYDDKKLTSAQIANLKSLQADVDRRYNGIKNFDEDKCRKDEKRDMKAKTEVPPGNSSSNSGNKKPMKVKTDWQNGVQNAQFMSLVDGDMATLKFGPRGVKVGAFKDRRTKEPAEPVQANGAFAQAEFFYDCSGEWDSSGCNNEGGTHESAMWHFKWRARLRRYTEPNAIAKGLIVAAAGEFGLQFLRFPQLSLSANEPLRLRLQRIAGSGAMNPKEMLVVH